MGIEDSGRSPAATEDMRQAPCGRCGDNPYAKLGCRSALGLAEEDNGVCADYPDCCLP
jgi:hypothetical protein